MVSRKQLSPKSRFLITGTKGSEGIEREGCPAVPQPHRVEAAYGFREWKGEALSRYLVQDQSSGSQPGVTSLSREHSAKSGDIPDCYSLEGTGATSIRWGDAGRFS